MESLLP